MAGRQSLVGRGLQGEARDSAIINSISEADLEFLERYTKSDVVPGSVATRDARERWGLRFEKFREKTSSAEYVSKVLFSLSVESSRNIQCINQTFW
jgi:hypothetical protein